MDDRSRAVLICAALYLVSSLAPAIKTKAWWVRVWDFPRLQLGFLALILLVTAAVMLPLGSQAQMWAFVMTGLGLFLDAYRIIPYSPLAHFESLPSKKADPASQIELLTCNVYQDNPKREPLLALIRKVNPDIVFLLEVDENWVRDCAELEKIYPYTLLRPQPNTYGLAFYSRLPLEDSEIKFLIEDDVPSIETTLTLKSGQKIKLFGTHPRPPRPQDGDSTERDAELILIGKKSKETTLPVIVMGDLNDVAWSHTTRHFRRISELLDPRVGRGPTPTFPVKSPLTRFPIDHVFHSRCLRIQAMTRLEDVGSDHFPLYARMSYEPEGEAEQEALEATQDDHQEARETVQAAREG